MKLEFQLSKKAELDLENIWEFTFTNWSIKQADKYINQIVDQINKICLNPKVGRPIFKVKPHHRMKKINSHLIIYTIDNHTLKVDRILHEKMDIENQL